MLLTRLENRKNSNADRMISRTAVNVQQVGRSPLQIRRYRKLQWNNSIMRKHQYQVSDESANLSLSYKLDKMSDSSSSFNKGMVSPKSKVSKQRAIPVQSVQRSAEKNIDSGKNNIVVQRSVSLEPARIIEKKNSGIQSKELFLWAKPIQRQSDEEDIKGKSKSSDGVSSMFGDASFGEILSGKLIQAASLPRNSFYKPTMIFRQPDEEDIQGKSQSSSDNNDTFGSNNNGKISGEIAGIGHGILSPKMILREVSEEEVQKKPQNIVMKSDAFEGSEPFNSIMSKSKGGRALSMPTMVLRQNNDEEIQEKSNATDVITASPVQKSNKIGSVAEMHTGVIQGIIERKENEMVSPKMVLRQVPEEEVQEKPLAEAQGLSSVVLKKDAGAEPYGAIMPKSKGVRALSMPTMVLRQNNDEEIQEKSNTTDVTIASPVQKSNKIGSVAEMHTGMIQGIIERKENEMVSPKMVLRQVPEEEVQEKPLAGAQGLSSVALKKDAGSESYGAIMPKSKGIRALSMPTMVLRQNNDEEIQGKHISRKLALSGITEGSNQYKTIGRKHRDIIGQTVSGLDNRIVTPKMILREESEEEIGLKPLSSVAMTSDHSMGGVISQKQIRGITNILQRRRAGGFHHNSEEKSNHAIMRAMDGGYLNPQAANVDNSKQDGAFADTSNLVYKKPIVMATDKVSGNSSSAGIWRTREEPSENTMMTMPLAKTAYLNPENKNSDTMNEAIMTAPSDNFMQMSTLDNTTTASNTGPDVENLASEVYKLIETKLEIERERMGM